LVFKGFMVHKVAMWFKNGNNYFEANPKYLRSYSPIYKNCKTWNEENELITELKNCNISPELSNTKWKKTEPINTNRNNFKELVVNGMIKQLQKVLHNNWSKKKHNSSGQESVIAIKLVYDKRYINKYYFIKKSKDSNFDNSIIETIEKSKDQFVYLYYKYLNNIELQFVFRNAFVKYIKKNTDSLSKLKKKIEEGYKE
ncbi:hypothetical protein MHK_001526, partial [Candidatus Magnetomorum sp. HK-1]